MLIGELLVAEGLANADQVSAALAAQKERGVQLGAILAERGVVKEAVVNAAAAKIPPGLHKVEDTGIARSLLLELVGKAAQVAAIDTELGLSQYTKLPPSIIRELVADAEGRGYLERRANPHDQLGLNQMVALTTSGRAWVQEALKRSLYVGPAPVPFTDYCQQVAKQSIHNERLGPETIATAFDGFSCPDWFLRVVGPAANSGRAVLFYGPPGNGKTTMAERLAQVFRGVVFIPHAIEVEGQIIRVYEHLLHQAVEGKVDLGGKKGVLLQEHHDPRWVPCTRPTVIAGAELTLDMLELRFDPISKVYEAPLHIKAVNGTLIVDDFGRQLVPAVSLLNRWIVPMESRVDFLKLQTGNSLKFPIDQLLIFTTNLEPRDLMDPAFLRRIHYKIGLQGPDSPQFCELLKTAASRHNLTLGDDDCNYVCERITEYYGESLSFFQPEFILRQIEEACEFHGESLRFDRQLANDALANLFVTPSTTGSTTAATASPSG